MGKPTVIKVDENNLNELRKYLPGAYVIFHLENGNNPMETDGFFIQIGDKLCFISYGRDVGYVIGEGDIISRLPGFNHYDVKGSSNERLVTSRDRLRLF